MLKLKKNIKIISWNCQQSVILKREQKEENRIKKRGEQKCSPPLKDVKFFLSFA